MKGRRCTTICRKVRVLFVAVSALLCAGMSHAEENPLFSYPGSQEPQRSLLYFYTGDYPSLRSLIRRVREQNKVGGLTRGVFSTWLKVPDDGRTHAVVRFNAGGGEGPQVHNSFLLMVRPSASGNREACFGKMDNEGEISRMWRLTVPWPEGKEWVHVTLNIDSERLSESGSALFEGLATLTVGDRTVQGKFWNDVESEHCAGVALGGAGVSVGPTLFLARPQGAFPTSQELRRMRPKAMQRRPHPQPLMAWDFNGTPANTGVLPVLRWIDSLDYVPTPNGQGVTGNRLLTDVRASIRSSAFTLAMVAKPERRDRAAFFSIRLFPDMRVHLHGRIMLKGSPTGVTLDYLPASPADQPQGGTWVGRELADDAFHHFAVTYDGSILRLFIDGEPVPGAIRLASRPVVSFMDEYRVLRDFQLSKLIGVSTYNSNPIIDDLAFWPRLLTPEELRTEVRRFRLSSMTRAVTVSSATSNTSNVASPSGVSVLRIPALPVGLPLPSEAEITETEGLIDELLDGETPTGATLLNYVRDAESDAARFVLLRRAEGAFLKSHRFAEALQVMGARARAFSGAVTDAEVIALAKEALRTHAIQTPDTALTHTTAVLTFAEAHHRPKVTTEVIRLANLLTRYLVKAKTYDDWRATVEAAERRQKAEAELERLRRKAASGSALDNRALADALALTGQWGEETLAAYIACEDSTLAQLAGEEAVSDGSATTALALGDGWWGQADACEKRAPTLAKAFRRHAATLYEKGKSAAIGLRIRLIQKRIEEGSDR